MAKTILQIIKEGKKSSSQPPWVRIDDAHKGDGELNLRTHLRIEHGGGEVYKSPNSNRIIHFHPDGGAAYVYELRKDKNGNTTHVRHVDTLRGSYAGAGFR